MRTLYDQDFFSKHSLNVQINQRLPLRLQKRELLRRLGFPTDGDLDSCQSKDRPQIRRLIETYSNSPPFLIVISQYNPQTIIPPLFLFRSADLASWRDCWGEIREINRSEAIERLGQLAGEDWLEFAYPLWGGLTLAGRLIYTNHESQILEIQQGVSPDKLLLDSRLPLYSGEISFCSIDPLDYLQRNRFLREAGYESILPLAVVKRICSFFQGKVFSLEELRKISPLPALEFAYGKQGLIIIDVDWPASWITQN